MHLLRINRLSIFILFVTALQLLNMSIDVPAIQVNNTAAADGYNYMDTYVEFVAEVLLQMHNAIPEQRHRHHRELQMHRQVQVICEQPETFLLMGAGTLPVVADYPAYTNNYCYRATREINHPPSFFG